MDISMLVLAGVSVWFVLSVVLVVISTIVISIRCGAESANQYLVLATGGPDASLWRMMYRIFAWLYILICFVQYRREQSRTSADD